MRLLHLLDNWISDQFDKLSHGQYWCCRHRWCYRSATYQYRCPKHMDDP